MSKIYLFRHAQASFMAKNYDVLSELGCRQSLALAKYLVRHSVHFDKIFVGPLERQKDTFEVVKGEYLKYKKDIPEPFYLKNLKEHDGTEAMKKALPELLERSPKVKKWWTAAQEDPKLKKRNTLLIFQYFMNEWATGRVEVEGIETWTDFRKKTQDGLAQIIKNIEKGETIGVFTSGGTIASIVAEALNMTDEERVAALNFSIRNTSFTTFLYSKKRFNLLSFNEIPHLEDALITFV